MEGLQVRVLIGCEFSATVRDAFRACGHNAWSCDLLPTTGDPRWHLQCDVITVLDQEWDLGIFHPDCTYLTASAEWAYGDGPYHQKVKPETLTGAARRAARNYSVGFVKRLMDAPIHRIAVENPIGCLSSRIRKPEQIVQPYEFGHDARKATCLWLKNLPPLTLDPAHYVKPRMFCPECKQCSSYDAAFGHGCEHCGAEAGILKPRWANQTDSGQNKLTPSADRWAARSLTYPGIAEAMAEQWGSLS